MNGFDARDVLVDVEAEEAATLPSADEGFKFSLEAMTAVWLVWVGPEEEVLPGREEAGAYF